MKFPLPNLRWLSDFSFPIKLFLYILKQPRRHKDTKLHKVIFVNLSALESLWQLSYAVLHRLPARPPNPHGGASQRTSVFHSEKPKYIVVLVYSVKHSVNFKLKLFLSLEYQENCHERSNTLDTE